MDNFYDELVNYAWKHQPDLKMTYGFAIRMFQANFKTIGRYFPEGDSKNLQEKGAVTPTIPKEFQEIRRRRLKQHE